MQNNYTLSGELEKDAQYLKDALRITESFDLSFRAIRTKGCQQCALFYINGFVATQTVQDFIRYCLNAESFTLSEETIPYVEASKSCDAGEIIKKILAGMTCLMIEGEPKAFLMDMRNIPARSVSEPENDKVLRGARDGFGETLQPNAALIRRRIRDPRLTFSVLSVGSETKSDVCLCYMDGKADAEFVKRIVRLAASR